MQFFSQATESLRPTPKTFKETHNFEKRLEESKRIKLKFPDRIPVIVERTGSTNISDIDKKKYLVPKDLSVGQFMYVIRKRIQLSPEESIYLFIDGTIPVTSALMVTEYDNKQDTDGFLYVNYAGESTFG